MSDLTNVTNDELLAQVRAFPCADDVGRELKRRLDAGTTDSATLNAVRALFKRTDQDQGGDLSGSDFVEEIGLLFAELDGAA